MKYLSKNCIMLLVLASFVFCSIGAGASGHKKEPKSFITRASLGVVLTRIPSFDPHPQSSPVCFAVVRQQRCFDEACEFTRNRNLGCGFRENPPSPTNSCCTVTFA